MSTETLSVFFALLSLACWAATAAIVVLVLVGWRSPIGSPTRQILRDFGAAALWLAWAVAAVTTTGSLYYSQVALFVPCELCWFQRICMYPQSVVLLVAALRRDRNVAFYVVPVCAIGAAIAAYHTQLQAFPEQQSFCSTTVPCTTRYVWEFGFVSLPFMALSAFCLIISCTVVARLTAASSSGTARADADRSPGADAWPPSRASLPQQ